MKRNFVLFVLATTTIVATSCATPTGEPTPSPTPARASTPVVTENVDATIRQLVIDRDAAIRTADTAAIERIYGDTYVSTGPTGVVRSKADVISDFKSGALKIESIESEDLKVQPYGDTAVVTGRTRIKGTDKGRALTGEQRFTQVYAKKDGRWQIVAFHLSSIAK
jgi:ketosteroid isomerase-like protein